MHKNNENAPSDIKLTWKKIPWSLLPSRKILILEPLQNTVLYQFLVYWVQNWDQSGVHVLLVSLLVDQLSGLFLIFFWSTKKNCPVSDLFCSLSWIFCPVFFKKWEIDRTIGRPRDWPKPHFQKRLDKKFKRVNKKDLILDKFFFGRPKKNMSRIRSFLFTLLNF